MVTRIPLIRQGQELIRVAGASFLAMKPAGLSLSTALLFSLLGASALLDLFQILA